MRVFPTSRFYRINIGLALILFIGYFVPIFFSVGKLLTFAFFLALAFDLFLIFKTGRIELTREIPERLSNGDVNEIHLRIRSRYRIPVSVTILDELPKESQNRDFCLNYLLNPLDEVSKNYQITPTERGEYLFGRTNTLSHTWIKLVLRKQIFGKEQRTKVYPSFLNLEKYELTAISQNLRMSGQKRMRRIGQSSEFDHIKDYVLGDDPRHINWKATARKTNLMINHFIDEKSQPIYSVIDKGRPMKMPFEGMTLLDFAINASLVLSNIAIKRGDRAGLITFQHKPETLIPAQKRTLQINYLLESLYKQKTQFNETDFSSLYTTIIQQLKQRSLLLLYTNFESIYSLERQLPYLRLINRHHLLLVIFFKNTELEDLVNVDVEDVRDVYNKSIANQLADEKRAIRKMLHQNGILSLYTRPQNLKVDVINKYIEIKTKRLL